MQQASDAPGQRASISAFFPCHNEGENVERVIGNALEHLPAIADEFEILIVNDGSTDDTAARAEAIGETDSRVRVVSHPTNLGYGRALRTGFESATGDLIFCADGDGQFSLDDLPPVVDALNDHGFVLGYRVNRADPFYRRLNAWLWGPFGAFSAWFSRAGPGLWVQALQARGRACRGLHFGSRRGDLGRVDRACVAGRSHLHPGGGHALSAPGRKRSPGTVRV